MVLVLAPSPKDCFCYAFGYVVRWLMLCCDTETAQLARKQNQKPSEFVVVKELECPFSRPALSLYAQGHFGPPRRNEFARQMVAYSINLMRNAYSILLSARVFAIEDGPYPLSQNECLSTESDTNGVLFASNTLARLLLEDAFIFQCADIQIMKQKSHTPPEERRCDSSLRIMLAACLLVSFKLIVDAPHEPSSLDVLHAFLYQDELFEPDVYLQRILQTESVIVSRIDALYSIASNSIYATFEHEMYCWAQKTNSENEPCRLILGLGVGHFFFHSASTHNTCDVLETLAQSLSARDMGLALACTVCTSFALHRGGKLHFPLARHICVTAMCFVDAAMDATEIDRGVAYAVGTNTQLAAHCSPSHLARMKRTFDSELRRRVLPSQASESHSCW